MDFLCQNLARFLDSRASKDITMGKQNIALPLFKAQKRFPLCC